MRRCRVRHPVKHGERCELPAGHKQRHQLIGGRTWKRGKASQAVYFEKQEITNKRWRAKRAARRIRAMKEINFQDRIRSKETVERYMRCAA